MHKRAHYHQPARGLLWPASQPEHSSAMFYGGCRHARDSGGKGAAGKQAKGGGGEDCDVNCAPQAALSYRNNHTAQQR